MQSPIAGLHLGLEAYGWSETLEARFAAFADSDASPARITRVDRGVHQVVTRDGTAGCAAADNALLPGSEHPPAAVGDWVALRWIPGAGWRLAAIVPRATSIRRSNPDDTGQQVLAANVDLALLLFGIDRPLKPGRMERMAAIVMENDIPLVVVITKVDLAGGDSPATAVTAAMTMGIEAVAVSAITGEGLDSLGSHLRPGVTAALLGESGAGKSTLVNRLAGDHALATGPTRRGDAKGRHTTTARHLVALPGGAVLIDTPGLRAVALTDTHHGVQAAFPDVTARAADCRFRDCAHAGEPGCAVLAAVGSGDLEARRLDSYRRLEREAIHQDHRAQERRRREPRGDRHRDNDNRDRKWWREE